MNTEAKVGAFVLICVAILSATIYSVGKIGFGAKPAPYKTYLRQAGGLEPGTDVLFGGIKVGKITAVRPDASDPTRIEIMFEVKQDVQINAKSVAKLGTVSVMSSPALSISTGSKDAPRLPAGAVIASEETMSLDDLQRKIVSLADSAQTLLTSMQANLNDISGDARRLMANLNDATGEENRKRFASVLANADAMVAQMGPKIDQISEEALKLTRDANGVITKIGPTVENVNTTVSNANGTITALREPIQGNLDELQKTLKDARALIDNVQAVVRANNQNITDTLENVRTATENINDLTQAVKERPWSLIRIKQPKDRKVPQ